MLGRAVYTATALAHRLTKNDRQRVAILYDRVRRKPFFGCQENHFLIDSALVSFLVQIYWVLDGYFLANRNIRTRKKDQSEWTSEWPCHSREHFWIIYQRNSRVEKDPLNGSNEIEIYALEPNFIVSL